MGYYDYFVEKAKYWKRKIKKHYHSHKAKIKITGCQIIPSLQRYVYSIKATRGNREQAILDRAIDVQSALGLPLFYPYKDGLTIHLAVSEHKIKENRLLKILRSLMFSKSDMEIPLALGYDLMGNMYITDLAKLLHLLVVGPTGSGKSVAIKSLTLSIIVRCPVNAVRLVVFEIGSNSLAVFNDVLHLYHPIVKDAATGICVLESLVAEMNDRYTLDEKECQCLPFIICVIDEFDDTIANIGDKGDSKRFAAALDSLIRKGRKVKIILILASHDPTIKTTGINVNGIESRIVFRVSKHQNSSTAGVEGTEKLPGEGAMIFKAHGKLNQLQGSWVTNAEIEQILSTAPAGYDNIDMLEIREQEATLCPMADELARHNAITEKANKLLADVAFWALGCETVSSLKIQQEFQMGKKANEFVYALYTMGIVGEKFANQPRKVLPTCIEDLLSETAAFFERYGYTEELIRDALNAKVTAE